MSFVNYTKLRPSGTLIRSLRKRFIAFDTETTGLDTTWNRIIEVGAVLFENGEPVRSYGSLIHSTDYVPYEARMVNHISNEMVRSAPLPEKVYPELMEFLGDALRGDTILVGHNATFDMKFLAAELRRMGESADIIYADTCAISRRVLPKLNSHSQDVVAWKLGVNNRQAHRAESDAETCGKIMVKMLPMLEANEKLAEEQRKREEKRIKNEPGALEKEVCSGLMESMREKGLPVDGLYLRQQGKLVRVYGEEPLVSLNVQRKQSFLVIRGNMLAWLRKDNELNEKKNMNDLDVSNDLSEKMELKPGTAGEMKLYEGAVRVTAPPTEGGRQEILKLAEGLLTRYLEERDKGRAGLDAARKWELMRERELYWRPEDW